MYQTQHDQIVTTCEAILSSSLPDIVTRSRRLNSTYEQIIQGLQGLEFRRLLAVARDLRGEKAKLELSPMYVSKPPF